MERSFVAGLLVVAALTGLPMPSQAQQVFSLGFEVLNTVPLPAEVPPYPGDLRFSDDGVDVLFVGDSEGPGSGIWTASVNRDVHGNVTSFGPAVELFPYPNVDTSIERYPGSETLFFTVEDVGIGQRSSSGTAHHHVIAGILKPGDRGLGVSWMCDPSERGAPTEGPRTVSWAPTQQRGAMS